MVGLESSVMAQGLPAPHNGEAAQRVDDAVRAAGAVPGVTGVVAGTPVIGLAADEARRFLKGAGIAKVSSRDLGAAIARRWDAATTVAASLTLCRAAGIRVFATGGIGGVHRVPAFDESADLVELARTPMVVVCAGAKSILDLRGTVERLETLGVVVVGYRTDEFPGFHYAATGLPVSVRVEDAPEVASIARAQWGLRHPGAVLVVQPPPMADALGREEVELAISAALAGARAAGVRGPATTPWLLEALARATGGRSIRTNLALLEANARLAADIAVCLARDDS